MRSEWDIFMNKEGFWCYRFQYRLKGYKEALGSDFNTIYATTAEWLDVNPLDKVVVPF